MNTFEQQEKSARRRFNPVAAARVGAGVGLFLFIFSGGAPWISGDTGYAVLGRPLPWPWLAIVLTHLGLCIASLMVIGAVVYRFNVWLAVPLGVVVSLVLYVVNQLVFNTMGYATSWGDAHALTSHIVLGLFGSALYKAVSVPKIARSAD